MKRLFLTLSAAFFLCTGFSIKATHTVLLSEAEFNRLIDDSLKHADYVLIVEKGSSNQPNHHYRMYKDGFYFRTIAQAGKFNHPKVTVIHTERIYGPSNDLVNW